MKLWHKHEWSQWIHYQRRDTRADTGQTTIWHRKHRHCITCGLEQDENQ